MSTQTFEKALAELEQTVAKLEKGDIALNESLALFEKGVKLARFLRGELDKAEREVEILLKDEKGGMKAEDFEIEDAGETPDGPKAGGGGASGRKDRDKEKGKDDDGEDIPF
jgi:exodeoxyribonuclease VII small subunit